MKIKGEEFEFFKKEVGWWVEYFGLYEWDWRVFHSKEEDDEGLAWVKAEEISGIAAVYLAKGWGVDPITPKNLSRSAFHEVCEVLLAELDWLSRKCVRDGKVDAATHRVIRRLENRIFEREYERRGIPENL
jgi:hypothetical protein